MKKFRAFINDISLRGKLLTSVAAAVVIASVTFAVLFYVSSTIITGYFDDDSKWQAKTEAKADEFQAYVTENGIASTDEEAIIEWNHDNRGVYLYIYNEEETIYETSRNIATYSYETYREVEFADQPCDLSIFYAIDYELYMAIIITEIILSMILMFYIVLRMVRNLVSRIQNLESDVKILEGGMLDHPVTVESKDEIGSLEQSLDNMRIALKNNIEREDELTRANSDLVTRMAHDLRTPLTSLLLYLDLMSSGQYRNQEELSKYISISKNKAERIKFMSDQLFERFLITGGSSETIDLPAPVRYVFEDTLSSLVMTLEAQGFETQCDLEWPECKVAVSTNYIDRILDNVYSNILKYADRTKPVRMSITRTGEGFISIRISNYIARRNNNTGGSNIGLGNIELMLNKMGGTLRVNDDGEIFEVIMDLPAAEL